MRLKMTKLHGLGNEFVVVTAESVPDMPDASIDWSAVARRVCSSEFGPGADGLLLLRRERPDQLSMKLWNADGSPAEMSGNGIRCLVHAATRADGARVPSVYRVQTDAGPRMVRVLTLEDDSMISEVEMGTSSAMDRPSTWSALGCHEDRPVMHLSLGNPHSVVGVESVDDVDLAALGSLVPDVNLEVIEPGPEPTAIRMRVHERGVGITRACGTGACAAAVAARTWGLIPAGTPEVTVHMDGGDVQVAVAPDGMVLLRGPSVVMSEHEVEL